MQELALWNLENPDNLLGFVTSPQPTSYYKYIKGDQILAKESFMEFIKLADRDKYKVEYKKSKEWIDK